MSTVSSTSSSTSAGYASYTSGFNATELAQIAYEDRLSKADSLTSQVSANTTKIAAYQSLQSLLKAVQVPLNSLRNSVKVTGSSSDSFLLRSVGLTSSDSSSAGSYLTATASYGTALGSHDIVVSQVAKAERLGSGEQTSSSAALSLAGTFTLGTVSADDGSSSPTSSVITITDSMSLSDIANAINVSQSGTGVSASVVQTSDSEYMLVLSGTNTDRQITLTAGSGTDVLTSLGVTTGTGAKAEPLQTAQAALLTIDGVSVTRSSNTISDALDGVTLNLYKPTVSTAYSTTTNSGSTVTSASVTSNTITLDISNDTSSVENEIDEFLSAYNSLRDFVLTNQALNTDGTASSSAVLFGDSILRGVTKSVQSILSSEVNGVSLGSIGISFDSNNYLVLDSSTLKEALSNSYSSVQSLFSKQLVGSTITVGIAQQLYSTIDTYANSYDSQIANRVSYLEDQDSDLTSRISTIQSNAEAYREFLLTKYSNIAAKLAVAQTTLTLLAALTKSSS